MQGGFKSVLNCFGLLWLRVAAGGMMALGHGLPKVQNFEQYSTMFPPLFGLDQKQTLMLAIFGELVCAALVALGLFTRLAALSVAITMVVAICVAHAADPLFMTGATVITTADGKVHVGTVTTDTEKEVILTTPNGSVTLPRSEIKTRSQQGSKEPAVLFLIPFAALVFTGPGKVSVDALLFRGKKQVMVKV